MLRQLVERFARPVVDRVFERSLEIAHERIERLGVPLRIRLDDGRELGGTAASAIEIVLRSNTALAAFANPSIGGLAKAYVEGEFDIRGSIRHAIEIADALAADNRTSATTRAALKLVTHTKTRDRADIAHHYDVSNEFYKLWLDECMVYSCAYFRTGLESIDEAQTQKLDHICRKLGLKPGERLLDIGCGWGGLVIQAAERYGVSAHGITLSQAQYDEATERVAMKRLQGRVRIELRDYRDLDKPAAYDKISSVGMFEHVGLANLPTYFSIIAKSLKEHGLVLNHGITSSDVDDRYVGGGVGEFIDDYVFPNGELPHLARVVREISAAQLEIVDVESLRPHYAKTLTRWSERLDAKHLEAAKLVSDKTLRVWRAYLAGCAHAFEQGWINIYQVLASKQTLAGLTTQPLTREYMYPRDAT
jgi:cyclopropane-fatty-acyl-phospholipid synthase